MSQTAEEHTPTREELADVNLSELVTTRLEESLPRILWLPLLYVVLLPAGIVWNVFWMGMPWTGFGVMAGGAYLLFGIQGAYVVIGCVFALIVFAAAVYGNLEPAQVQRVRDYGARGRNTLKWYAYYSLF